MKTIATKLIVVWSVIIAALSLILTGCASDGSIDAVGISKAVTAVSDAYQQIQGPRVVGYDAAGQPLYR